VFIDLLLELTGQRLNDQQLKDEISTMMAAVRESVVPHHLQYWWTLLCVGRARQHLPLSTVYKQGCQFASKGFPSAPWPLGLAYLEASNYPAYCHSPVYPPVACVSQPTNTRVYRTAGQLLGGYRGA
jgi:hypothetical protein